MQVEALVAKGANVLAEDEKGHTALHLAAMEGHVGMVQVLAAEGGLALVMHKSKAGRTAVDWAAFNGHVSAEQALRELQDAMQVEEQQLQESKSTCRQRADSMAAEYVTSSSSSSKRDMLLNEEEYAEFAYHILLGLASSQQVQAQARDGERFVAEARDLICGEFEQAARGFYKLLHVNESEVYDRARAGVAAIEEEVRALGDRNVSEQLNYILRQRASEKMFPNGLRDKGHAGMLLQDFVQHKHAVAAELEEREVVALRLYTTSAFQQINNPLRDQERISRGDAHPLPVTVMLIVSGIKKLRAVDAGSDDATQELVLWRGMKNIRPTDHFAQKGGTEVTLRMLCVCMCVLVYCHC